MGKFLSEEAMNVAQRLMAAGAPVEIGWSSSDFVAFGDHQAVFHAGTDVQVTAEEMTRLESHYLRR